MEIHAAVVNTAGEAFSMQTLELEGPRSDEVLVRIAAVGLCHTDLLVQQYGLGREMPLVLGHEGAGVVEKIGSEVTGFTPGDRVVISFRSCGVCPKCQAGCPSYCPKFAPLNYSGCRPDGSHAIHRDADNVASNFFGQSSFASHALTYARNLVKLPNDIGFHTAAPLSCGVQTGAGSIINSLACEPNSSLLVTGGGTVGLSAVMAGRIRACGVIIVVEPLAARRRLALELGATHVIDPAEEADLAASVREILPLGVDYALDTTGRPDTLTAVMRALAPQGLLGCVGVPPPGTPVPGDLNMMIGSGHRVMGIVEGDSDPSLFIPELIAHYRAGRLPVDRLVGIYPLEQINRAVADQHAGACVKVVLTVE